MACIIRKLCSGIAALTLSALLATTVLSFSPPAWAEDTEVYFSNSVDDEFIRPNLVFIVDTSESMNEEVSGTGNSRLETMKDALKTVINGLNNVDVALMRFSNPGGPLLFPAANLEASAEDVEGSSTTASADIQIVDGDDDAEESSSDGGIRLDSVDLELGDLALGPPANPQLVGVRFQNVNVPQGVTITKAVIRFTAEELDTSVGNLFIDAELSDNAAPFTTTPFDISLRSLTSAPSQVNWSAGSDPALTSWSAVDEVHETPDLAAIVQEVVGQSGWCGGNAMAFVISGSGQRTTWSADANGATSDGDLPESTGKFGRGPVLHLEWNKDNAGGCVTQQQSAQAQVNASSDDAEESQNGNTVLLTDSDLNLVKDGGSQKVGIRFQDLAIPQGVTITNAEIEFTIDQVNTQSLDLQIEGEDSDNASTFENTPDNISGRTKTTAIAWNDVTPPGAVGDKLVTPDLSATVQTIVNRSGWTSGNAMAFIITSGGGGPGSRIVESFDGEPAMAPVLRITYQSATTFTTVRQRLTEMVDQLQWKAGSPIVDTLYEAALYYRGENVDSGTTRGVAPRQQFTRVSHPGSYTGGTLAQPTGCSDDDLNAAECAGEQIDPTPVYTTPITQECQANYVVLLSDGEATDNNSETKITSLAGGSCADSDEGRCGAELVSFLKDEDQNTDLDSDQTVRTYTIGFDTAGNAAYLQNLASAGGGEFFSASNAAGLVDAIQNVVSQVLEAPTSFAAPSLSVNAFNRLFNRDAVYFALFEPSDTKAWVGNLKKFQLCSDPSTQSCDLGEILDANGAPAIDSDFKIKSTAVSFWGDGSQDGPDAQQGGAGDHIPNHANRTVLTYTGTDDSPTGGVLLDNTHFVNTTNVSKTMLGDANMIDALHAEIIGWLQGQDVRDENDNSDTDEDRWTFADPLHSRPIAITYGAEDDVNGDPDPDKPIIKLLVGTNDGGLRMINEQTGEEEWIFYVPELLDQAQDLMNDAPGDHIYGVDGTPTVRTIDNNGDGIIDPNDGDSVQVFSGLRRGGSNLYALDITPSSVLTDADATGQITPTFMWRIIGDGTGDFDHLGQTWSTPLVANIRSGNGGGNDGNDSEARPVLIFGGGNEVPAQDDDFAKTDPLENGTGTGNAIYIVDALDGSRVFWASNTNSGADLELAGMDYPIPADVALIDADRDGETDRLYAVDTGGQVWRIDLDPTMTENNAGNTAGGKLAAISIPGATPDFLPDDERRMFARVDVAQVRDEFFSSVPEYDAVVVGTGFRAHPNNIEVHDRIYIFRDYLFNEAIATDGSNFPLCNNSSIDISNPLVPCSPLGESNLVDLTDDLLQEGTIQDIDDATDDLLGGNGWFIQLKDENDAFIGEKVLVKATIIDGIIFVTSFTPADTSSDPCAADEGNGQVFALNLFSGGAVIDFNNNGTLEKADRVAHISSGIPSEVVPVFQDDGVTLLIGSGGGAAAIDPGIGLPRDKTFWFQE